MVQNTLTYQLHNSLNLIIYRYRTSVRDRSSLGLPESSSPYAFTPPHSGRSSPFNDTSNAGMGHRYADDIEGQNDEALEGLSAKVKLLKDVSEFCLSFLLVLRAGGVRQ